MYLLPLDEKTGMIKDDATHDSWRGIKVFRELVEQKGIEALTVVALAVDYESPIRNYKKADRIYRAMEEVYGNRKKFKSDSEQMKECLDKYSDLQFNEELEQYTVFRDIKINILERLSAASRGQDDAEVSRQTKNLQNHETTLKSFKSTFSRENAMTEAVTSSGYVLSRIENDLLNRKNSKFLDKANAVNPNNLNLEN